MRLGLTADTYRPLFKCKVRFACTQLTICMDLTGHESTVNLTLHGHTLTVRLTLVEDSDGAVFRAANCRSKGRWFDPTHWDKWVNE